MAGRRRVLFSLLPALVVTVLAVTAVAGDAAPTGAPLPPAPPAGDTAVGVLCVGPPGPDAEAVCSRMAADIGRRRRLTPAELSAAEAAGRRASAALGDLAAADQTTSCDQQACSVRGGAPRPADVPAAEAALARAGFPGAMVRLARADDPAPAGSLLYGVPAGGGCVLGWQNGDGGSETYGGPLPGGGCLAR